MPKRLRAQQTIYGGFKKQRTTAPAPTTASGVKAMVRRTMLNTLETKNRSITGTEVATVADSGPIFIPMPIIPNGDTQGQRTGNKIILTGISVNAVHHNNSTTNLNATILVRELLLKFDANQYDTTAELESQLFEGSPDTGNASTNLAFVRTINREGIQVLMDRKRFVNPGASAGSTSVLVTSINKKLNQTLTYPNVAGGSQPTNYRYIYVWIPNLANNDVDVLTLETTYEMRVFYKDV